MNILFIIGGLSGGGAERVTCNLADFLLYKGHEVSIITMSDDKPSYFIDSHIERKILLFNNERKSSLENIILRIKRFRSYLYECQADVVIAFLPVTIIMLLLFRKKTSSRVVAAERVDPSEYPTWMRFALKRLAKKANGWVFQTKEERDWYGNRVGKAHVQVIPNAINPDFIKDVYHGERNKTIVTAGRLTGQKNHTMLIQAFAKISPFWPEYQLVILGDGPLKMQLESVAKEEGVWDKVKLPGYTTNIGEKIKDASLFVLSSDFEGMPNALMEAMALGLPCISTDCKGGGARFLIDDGRNGLITPIGDVDALAKALERMLSDREFACQCGREAYKICERLAPERIYGEWESFIKEIVRCD